MKRTWIVTVFILACVFFTGCDSAARGSLAVEESFMSDLDDEPKYEISDELFDVNGLRTGSESRKETIDSSIGDYPYAFYFPDNHSMLSTDIQYFQILDLIDEKETVYAYQTMYFGNSPTGLDGQGMKGIGKNKVVTSFETVKPNKTVSVLMKYNTQTKEYHIFYIKVSELPDAGEMPTSLDELTGVEGLDNAVNGTLRNSKNFFTDVKLIRKSKEVDNSSEKVYMACHTDDMKAIVYDSEGRVCASAELDLLWKDYRLREAYSYGISHGTNTGIDNHNFFLENVWLERYTQAKIDERDNYIWPLIIQTSGSLDFSKINIDKSTKREEFNDEKLKTITLNVGMNLFDEDTIPYAKGHSLNMSFYEQKRICENSMAQDEEALKNEIKGFPDKGPCFYFDLPCIRLESLDKDEKGYITGYRLYAVDGKGFSEEQVNMAVTQYIENNNRQNWTLTQDAPFEVNPASIQKQERNDLRFFWTAHFMDGSMNVKFVSTQYIGKAAYELEYAKETVTNRKGIKIDLTTTFFIKLSRKSGFYVTWISLHNNGLGVGKYINTDFPIIFQAFAGSNADDWKNAKMHLTSYDPFKNWDIDNGEFDTQNGLIVDGDIICSSQKPHVFYGIAVTSKSLFVKVGKYNDPSTLFEVPLTMLDYGVNNGGVIRFKTEAGDPAEYDESIVAREFGRGAYAYDDGNIRISNLKNGVVFYELKDHRTIQASDFPTARSWKKADGTYIGIGFPGSHSTYTKESLPYARLFDFKVDYEQAVIISIWDYLKKHPEERYKTSTEAGRKELIEMTGKGEFAADKVNHFLDIVDKLQMEVINAKSEAVKICKARCTEEEAQKFRTLLNNATNSNMVDNTILKFRKACDGKQAGIPEPTDPYVDENGLLDIDKLKDSNDDIDGRWQDEELRLREQKALREKMQKENNMTPEQWDEAMNRIAVKIKDNFEFWQSFVYKG